MGSVTKGWHHVGAWLAEAGVTRPVFHGPAHPLQKEIIQRAYAQEWRQPTGYRRPDILRTENQRAAVADYNRHLEMMPQGSGEISRPVPGIRDIFTRGR